MNDFYKDFSIKVSHLNAYSIFGYWNLPNY